MSFSPLARVLALASTSLLAAGSIVPAATALEPPSAPTPQSEAASSVEVTPQQKALLEKLKDSGSHRDSGSERVRVFVMMKKQPNTPNAQAEKTAIRTQSDLAATWKKDYGLTIDRQFGYLINGFSGEMPANKMAALALDPNVESVRKERVYYRLEHSARELEGVPAAFAKHGVDGTGTVIAVIDSGVNPAHPDMRLDDCDSAKITTINTQGPFTCKVPNGYNYADESFEVRDLTSSQHGQHVAGIAAANGSEGDTSEFAETGRIDGVAPNAQILAMKVFSNDESHSGFAMDGDIIAAIEDSVKMKADVINMSLGSPNGLTDESEGTTFAIEAAREQGVLTVVAAGNEGQNFSLTGVDDDVLGRFDDGTAGWPSIQAPAFSVASIENAVSTKPVATFGTGSDRTQIPYLPATGKPDGKEHPMVYVNLGREGDYTEGQDLAGAYALIQRGEISFAEKYQRAIDHGASGVIIFNNAAGGEEAPGMAGVDTFTVFGVSLGHSDGQAIVDALAKDPATTIAFTDKVAPVANPGALKPSTFTSWGTTNTLDFTPEIAGIGGNVYSTVGANGYATMSGTSMATPNLAGLSALLFEAYAKKYPTLSRAELVPLIETTLMNTAQPPVNDDGVPYGPRRIGAGLAQVDRALDTDVTATVDGSPSVALREVNSARTFTITLTNRGSKAVTYTVPAQEVLTETNEAGAPTTSVRGGGSLAASASTITVQPGSTATLNVTLVPDTSSTHFVEGWVRLEAKGNAPDLAVPYMGFVGDWNAENIIQEPGKPWIEGGPADSTQLQSGLPGVGNVPIGNPQIGPLAISPNGDGLLDSVVPSMLLMRNADRIRYDILDKSGKKVLFEVGEDENKRRVTGTDVANATAPGSLLSAGRAFNGKVWDPAKGEYVSLPDGTYSYRLQARLGDSFDWQTTTIPFTVDTTAPKVSIQGREGTTVRFTATDAGSGLIAVPGVYGPDGTEYEVTKQADGTFTATVPENVPFVTVEALDRGFTSTAVPVVPEAGYLYVTAEGFPVADDNTVVVSDKSTGGLQLAGVLSPDITRVSINGKDAKISGAAWSYTDADYTGGPVTLTIIGYNSSGKAITTRTVSVVQDRTAPTLSFAGGSLKDGFLVPEANGTVTISGTVTDEREGAKVSVKIGNENVPIKADGTFTHTVTLTDRDSVIVVQASDGVNLAEKALPIAGRYNPLPQVKAPVVITSPYCEMPTGLCYVDSTTKGVSKDGSTLTVKGSVREDVTSLELIPGARAKDGGEITQGKPIPATINDDGTFTVDVSLPEWINELRVVAKNSEGKVVLDRGLTVFFDITPPHITFDEPSLIGGTLYTNQDSVVFKGSIYDDGWGHFLALNNAVVTDFWRFNNAGPDVNTQDFEQVIAVRDGDKISVYSNDPFGNEIVGVIPVIVDKEAPTAGVDSVKSGEIIRDKRTLEAWAKDKNLAHARITLNGDVLLDEATDLSSEKVQVENVLKRPDAEAPDPATKEGEESKDAGDVKAADPVTHAEGTETTTAQTRLSTTIDTADLSAGKYTVVIETTDLAGNITTEARSFVVDAPAVITGPDAVRLDVTDEQLTDQKALAARVLDQYKVTDDGSPFAEGETVLSLAPGTVLAPGTQQVTVIATDADGRVVPRLISVTLELPKTTVPIDDGKDGKDTQVPTPAQPGEPVQPAPGSPGKTTDGEWKPGEPGKDGTKGEGKTAPGKKSETADENGRRGQGQAQGQRSWYLPRTGSDVIYLALVGGVIISVGAVALGARARVRSRMK